MVLRIQNIGKWSVLNPGETLTLPGDFLRRIRLEVNCPAPTRFDVVDDNGVLTFVGVVQGLETIEFIAGYGVSVTATSDDEVWYTTVDGETIATEWFDQKSWAGVENRRERNPQLEAMMQRAETNMVARLTSMEYTIQQRVKAALEAMQDDDDIGATEDTVREDEAAPGDDTGAGEGDDTGTGTDTGGDAAAKPKA